MMRRGFSLLSRGLNAKTFVAFCLMSIVPFLVLIYIVTNFTPPAIRSWWDLWLVLGIVAVIAVLGFIVIRSFVVPVVKLAQEAQTIAGGSAQRQETAHEGDEVGILARSLNEIKRRVSEQMAIALENDLLVKRAKKLEILDETTGLYNAAYSKSRLEEEIHRAVCFHRSCSLVLLSVDNFRGFQERHGAAVANKLIVQVAELIRGEIGQVDRAGRVGPEEFCIILPEKNKKDAILLAEKIRRRVEAHVFGRGSKKLSEPITVSGGVSENPLDGSSSEELFEKAAEFTKVAKEQGRNKIVPTLQGHLTA